MRKIFCLLLLLLLLVTGCGQGSGGKDAAAGGSYTVTDEHGTVTTFKQAPQKVLTLALSSDGIIMGLGMEDKLVAVNYLAVNREGYLNQSQIARKARNHAGYGLFLYLRYFQKVSTAHRK